LKQYFQFETGIGERDRSVFQFPQLQGKTRQCAFAGNHLIEALNGFPITFGSEYVDFFFVRINEPIQAATVTQPVFFQLFGQFPYRVGL
jgi:hypothetical protein